MKINSKFALGLAVGLLLLSNIAFGQTIRNFQDVINAGKNIGFFEVFLPFILAFAVFYGLLIKSGIFGDAKQSGAARTISVIVALASAAYVIIATPVGITLAQFLTTFTTNAFVAILAAMVFLIGLTMFVGTGGGLGENPLTKYAGWVVLIVLIGALAVYVQAGGNQIFPGLPGIIPPGADPTFFFIIAAIFFVGILAWLLTRGESLPPGTKPG